MQEVNICICGHLNDYHIKQRSYSYKGDGGIRCIKCHNVDPFVGPWWHVFKADNLKYLESLTNNV